MDLNNKQKISFGVIATAFIALIAVSEGQKEVPYRDLGGVLTVCNGHTGADIDPKKTYSSEECKDFARKDAEKAYENMYSCVNVPLTRGQVTAFSDLTYNVGKANFCGSTLVKKLNAMDYVGACNELTRWVKAGGIVYPGLVKRREEEKNICLHG